MIAQPYPGLRPFNRDEDEIFFGREIQVNQLLDKLADIHFLAVLGISGSGKSSLVRAGLLPALDGGFMAGVGARWTVAELRPGDRPFQRLAASLVRDTEWGKAFAESEQTSRSGPPDRYQTPGQTSDSTAPTDTDEAIAALERDLRRGSLALNWRLGVQPLTEGTRLLILVDQFEELFRYHRGAGADANAFVALLLGAATHPDVYLVITMRSEFLGDCSLYPDLPEAINAGLFLTPSLTPEQMADAVQLPARLSPFNGEVDPALVRRLLTEARNRTDQLPLLQHALMRLWDQAGEKKHLGLKGLEDMGGLGGGLNAHVEEACKDLSSEQQRIAEVMFRALTERSGEKRDTRRPAPLGEIAQLAGVTPDDVASVVKVFRRPGRSFLMPPAGTKLKTDTILDITHEALIRQWQRLQKWTKNEAEQAELYQRLEAAARRHRDGQGALLIDPDLQFALKWRDRRKPTARWAERYGGDFDLVMGFLDASREEREKELEERKERRRQKIRQARFIALVSLIAFLISAALAGWATYERSKAQKAEIAANAAAETAQRHAKLAEAEKTRADTAARLAKQQATIAESEKQQRTRDFFDASLTHASLLARGEDFAEAREVLRRTVELDPDIPETRRHARNLLAGEVAILGGSADKIYEGAGAGLTGGVAVSPDGRWLAAAGERGTLVLFDAASGALVKRLEGHDPSAASTGDIRSVVFDPEGRFLFSGGDDRRIIRWSVPNGEKLNEWQTPARVWALAISPDGKVLASGRRDDAIILWSTDTDKQLRILEGHTSAIGTPNGLDFSPDGKRLASASYDKTARIWDVATGQSLHTLQWYNDKLNVVTFSAESNLVATGSYEKRIVLWDANTGRPFRLFTGHDNIVFDVAFDAAGRRLLSTSRDNTLRQWDVATGVTLRVYQGHTAGLWSVARHGDTFYTSSDDQTVRRWSLATPGQWVWELPGEPNSAGISPLGEQIVIGFADGTLRSYSLPAGKPLWEYPGAHTEHIYHLAFNRNGDSLATAGFDDKIAKIWAVDEAKITQSAVLEGHTGAVYSVAFSPDGSTLATAGYDGRVGLFGVESGKGDLFEAHDGRIHSVSYTNDGNSILTEDHFGFLRLWDLTKQPPEPREVARAKDMLLWAALRPDGRQLAAVGREYVVTLHDLGPQPAEPRLLVGHEQTVFRAIYSPDGRQLATMGGDMTVRLWDLETHKELFALRLPDMQQSAGPWDFDFSCTERGECWIAVPLTMGRLALYRLPYDHPLESLTNP